MTKREFLMALNDELYPLSEDERSAAIKYYSDYIDAWRAWAQAWYDEWKAANPGQKRIHESGSMKGREVTIRTK